MENRKVNQILKEVINQKGEINQIPRKNENFQRWSEKNKDKEKQRQEQKG
jgi:hypothetical protein